MDWIVETHEKFYDRVYDKWVISKIDWGRIDNDHKYGKAKFLDRFIPNNLALPIAISE